MSRVVSVLGILFANVVASACLAALLTAQDPGAGNRRLLFELDATVLRYPAVAGQVEYRVWHMLSVVAAAHRWADPPETIDVTRKIDHEGWSVGVGAGIVGSLGPVGIMLQAETGKHLFDDNNRTGFFAVRYGLRWRLTSHLGIGTSVVHQRTLSFQYPDHFGDSEFIVYPSRTVSAWQLGMSVF